MAQANGGEGASASPVTPLSDIFDSSSKPAAPDSQDSSEEEKKKKTAKPDKVPASDKGEHEPSPKKKEGEEKPEKDVTPADDKSVRQKPDKDESDEKGEKKDKPAKDKPADNADNKDAKPAKDASDASQNDPYEKRWKDTQAWANRVNQEKLQLQQEHQRLAQQVDILQKKLADPEYDPEKDPRYAGPTPEQIAETAVYAGKATASRDSAIREFAAEFEGDTAKSTEKVQNELRRFNDLFKENEAVQMAVRQSSSPVHEAMMIMERVDFTSKYGQRPKQIYDNIKKEVVEETRKSLRKELIEELREGKALKDESVRGLSDSRSGNGTDSAKSKGAVTHTPLSEIFPNNR